MPLLWLLDGCENGAAAYNYIIAISPLHNILIHLQIDKRPFLKVCDELIRLNAEIRGTSTSAANIQSGPKKILSALYEVVD